MVNTTTPVNESFNLLNIWKTLRKRKFVSLGITAVVFGGVALYTAQQTPIYESEMLILIDNRKELPVVPIVDQATNNITSSLETEIQILRSLPLIGRAVRSAPAPYNALPPESVAGNLSIGQLGEAGVLKISFRDTVPERAKAILNALGNVYVSYSQESRRSKAANAIKFIEQQLPNSKKELEQDSVAVREFRRKYNVPDPDSYATNVSSAQQSLQLRIQEIEIAIAQGQRQFDELRAQVGEDPDVALSTIVLSQDATYQRLVTQYKTAESEYGAKRKAGFTDRYPPVRELKDRLGEYLRQMQQQASSVLGPAKAAQLRRSKGSVVAINPYPATDLGTGTTSSGAASSGGTPIRQGLQQSLAQEMITLKISLAVQREQLLSLRKFQGQTAQKFKEIPRLQQEYTEMQRRLGLSSSKYNSLLSKLEELRISEAQETSTWKVLEPPFLPGDPIAPKRNQNLLYGLIAGLFLGVGAAFVPELLNERLKGVDEAKEITGLPVLGAIPKTDEPLDSAAALRRAVTTAEETKGYTTSPFKESLRSLALSLRYLGSSKTVKTLLITSSIPAEGKSVLTYNLGLVLAEFGRRVLVVDADMRKASLHRYLGLTNTEGLSTTIATELPWRPMVQPAIHPNLSVLSAGPIPPNPVALLNSPRMEELLEDWREHYDYVLIDTPPILGLPDAQSLLNRVDRVILVASIDRTTRSLLTRSVEILRSSQCDIAGVIVNLLSDTSDGYYHQYYASYYATDSEESNPNGRKSRGLLGLFRR